MRRRFEGWKMVGMSRWVGRGLVCGVVAAGLGGVVRGSPVMTVSSTGSTISNAPTQPDTMGWSFTTGTSAVSVTALDAFLSGETSAGVRIYGANQVTLASATVTTTDPTETAGMTWNVHAITPITLLASTTYYIAQDEAGGAAAKGNGTVSLGLGLTYVGGLFVAGLGGNPTGDSLFGNARDPAFFGPNFDAVAVPEPGTVGMVAGLAGVLVVRRRRRGV